MEFENALPRLQILDGVSIQKIYFAALEVLERTGVEVQDQEARELLEQAGAKVENGVARIPSWLIEKTVNLAPKQIVIYTQDGRPAMRLANGNFYFGTGENTVFMVDSFMGERRKWTRKDVIDAVVLQDNLEHFDYVMPLGLMSDCHPEVSHLCQFEVMVTYTNKPVVSSGYDAQGVRDLCEMASVVTGTGDLSQKPFMIQLMASLSPLIHARDALGKLLASADRGIPVIYSCLQSGGATSPVTLAGTLVINLAEGLSGLAIAQLKREGAPFIMPGVSTTMDMGTTISPYGSPEFNLMICALSDIYHWLGLPTFGTAGCSDSKVADEQAAMEACFSCVTQALSGSNVIHDIGYLESGLTGSMDLMVMTHELLGMVKRFKRGIHIDEESLALDVIDRVGIGGQYVTEDHTLHHFRSETWQADLFDRERYEEWKGRGGKDLTERAKDRIMSILSQPESKKLEKRQTDELAKIIKRREGKNQVCLTTGD